MKAENATGHYKRLNMEEREKLYLSEPRIDANNAGEDLTHLPGVQAIFT